MDAKSRSVSRHALRAAGQRHCSAGRKRSHRHNSLHMQSRRRGRRRKNVYDGPLQTIKAAGGFGHYKIAEGTSTELAGNSNGEVAKLKATIAGAAVTFTSSSATGSGTMENKVEVGGEHFAHGEGTIVFNEITVSTPKCFAYTDEAGAKGAKGTVDTEKLTVTTKGQGSALKLTPAAGEVFARFWVLDANKKTSAEGGKCPIASTYTITGSIKGVPDGATARMTHAESTAQGTLKLGTGAKVGIKALLPSKAETPKSKEIPSSRSA